MKWPRRIASCPWFSPRSICRPRPRARRLACAARCPPAAGFSVTTSGGAEATCLPCRAPRPGTGKGPFQARYEFVCNVDIHHPTSPMTQLTRNLYAEPRPGEYTRSEPRIDPSDPDIAELALHLTAELPQPVDQVRALFRHV